MILSNFYTHTAAASSTGSIVSRLMFVRPTRLMKSGFAGEATHKWNICREPPINGSQPGVAWAAFRRHSGQPHQKASFFIFCNTHGLVCVACLCAMPTKRTSYNKSCVTAPYATFRQRKGVVRSEGSELTVGIDRRLAPKSGTRIQAVGKGISYPVPSQIPAADDLHFLRLLRSQLTRLDCVHIEFTRKGVS